MTEGERLEKAEQERDRYRQLYLDTLERCRKLELGLLGQKSERLPSNEAQLALQVLGQMLGPQPEGIDVEPEPESSGAAPDKPAKPEPDQRRRGGRQVPPAELPRVEIEVVPDEVQREGLDAFERIGEQVTEVLERRPASVVVVRVIRPKFVRKDRSRNAETEVLTALPVELPIARGLAGPGLLADTIVRRWADHLPTHRLEKIYARDGVHLARSTIGGWHEQLAELVAPLIDAMWADAMASPVLCTDATGVLVQASEQCSRAHFFVVVAPGRHVLFRFTAKHNKDAVRRILGEYKGFLVADAHSVFDFLYADGDVLEVGCWAHARRYYFKAMFSEPERAREGLAMIGQLFRIERELDGATRKQREKTRHAKSRPIVDSFLGWCERERQRALDDTPLARALGYTLNQRDALRRFLDDGRLPLDNNVSERELRREAVGRKNWLFVGSDDGGAINATFVTLIASCQLHGIEPWAYLRDLLCLIPQWPRSRVLELAPAYWRETLEQQEAQEILADNLCRLAMLALDAHQPGE